MLDTSPHLKPIAKCTDAMLQLAFSKYSSQPHSGDRRVTGTAKGWSGDLCSSMSAPKWYVTGLGLATPSDGQRGLLEQPFTPCTPNPVSKHALTTCREKVANSGVSACLLLAFCLPPAVVNHMCVELNLNNTAALQASPTAANISTQTDSHCPLASGRRCLTHFLDSKWPRCGYKTSCTASKQKLSPEGAMLLLLSLAIGSVMPCCLQCQQPLPLGLQTCASLHQSLFVSSSRTSSPCMSDRQGADTRQTLEVLTMQSTVPE